VCAARNYISYESHKYGSFLLRFLLSLIPLHTDEVSTHISASQLKASAMPAIATYVTVAWSVRLSRSLTVGRNETSFGRDWDTHVAASISISSVSGITMYGMLSIVDV